MGINDRTEWLEADGLGGFASGTTSGIRTRRYHALLLTATAPPTGRMVLVNGFDAWIEIGGRTCGLTTQRYAPDVLDPDGASRLIGFEADPWPTWTFDLGAGRRLRQEMLVQHGTGHTLVRWTADSGADKAVLRVRPFLSGRDYHSVHRENAAFRFEPTETGSRVVFTPYDGVPSVICCINGRYQHAPEWYRNFLYRDEHERGLDAIEDLASPGVFEWTLEPGGEAVWLMAASTGGPGGLPGSKPLETGADAATLAAELVRSERERRAGFPSPLERAADAYLARRRSGRTIVAGYPWFTDWGRDTFIAIRGLCLATGRLAEARDILLEWAAAVSEGMLPNRFPDHGEEPEFNSVDASLWYVIAVHELLSLAKRRRTAGGPLIVSPGERQMLEEAVLAIVGGYAAGTRFGIRMDSDALLMAGVPGVQLTWMDARVGDRVVTPRIGKPVEIEALWLNALHVAARLNPHWAGVFAQGRTAFEEKFWDERTGSLADVVDVDHVAGTRDDTCRPNQILAVGGLPIALIRGARARRLVDRVERELLTPIGLRSLAPSEAGYAARYEGDSAARDAVYHQGTVWPWLMGAFVQAWVRVRGNRPATRAEARRRFLDALRAHLNEAGLNHISEIADAEPPFTPRGCPFQAWSLGEFIRLDRQVLRGHDISEPTESRRALAQIS